MLSRVGPATREGYERTDRRTLGEPKVEARRTRHRCRIADDGSSFIDTYTQVLEDHILVRSERIIDENPFPGTFSV
jgi:hypothetical protein